jgi:hypothetical protein
MNASGVTRAESCGQPVGLAGTFGVVGVRAAGLLGDPGGDEAEQGGPFGDRGLDDLFPALDAVRAGDLVRAVGAVACVAGAEGVVPGVDAPQQPPARSDDLCLVLDDVAGELDLVERAAGPVGEIAQAACVDACAARVRCRLDPRARAVAWQRPVKRVKTPVPSLRRNL